MHVVHDHHVQGDELRWKIEALGVHPIDVGMSSTRRIFARASLDAFDAGPRGQSPPLHSLKVQSLSVRGDGMPEEPN
jgi:hypothetical protein